MICAKCGGEFEHPHEIKTYGMHNLCNHCLASETRCTVCGKKRFNKDENGVCEDCSGVLRPLAAPTLADVIPNLDEVLAQARATVVKNPPEKITQGEVCNYCGGIFDIIDTVQIEGKTYCKHCAARKFLCSICGEYKTDVKYTPSRGRNICSCCRHRDGIGIEHVWNYRPPKFFKHGCKSAELYLGIENEVKVKNNVDKDVYIDHISKSYMDNVLYTQYDGSINYGTEIVIHPHTFSSLKKFDFKPIFNGDILGDRSTGMHVHISRKAFKNKLHLYKFMKFISTNPNFVEKVACRKSGGKAQWRFTRAGILIAKAKGRRVDPDKYVDINLKHPDTIELRIFKGVTTEYAMRRNIEFCHALFKFSQKQTPTEMYSTYFKEFVFNNQSKYPNLNKYLSTAKFN